MSEGCVSSTSKAVNIDLALGLSQLGAKRNQDIRMVSLVRHDRSDRSQ